MLINLERAGKFHASTMHPNPHKCAAMRTRTYQYHVRIEASDKVLTPEGFLINNERLQEYFDSRFGHKAPKWEAISCEHMALAAAQELSQIMLNDGIDVQCVECRILGSNGATIEGIWRKPNIGENNNADTVSQAIA
jgi:hypothetical protein